VDERRSSTAVLPPMKFDGNFPQSEIPAFHKISFLVTCPLFLLPPFEPHIKQTPAAKSKGFKGRGNKKLKYESDMYQMWRYECGL